MRDFAIVAVHQDPRARERLGQLVARPEFFGFPAIPCLFGMALQPMDDGDTAIISDLTVSQPLAKTHSTKGLAPPLATSVKPTSDIGGMGLGREELELEGRETSGVASLGAGCADISAGLDADGSVIKSSFFGPPVIFSELPGRLLLIFESSFMSFGNVGSPAGCRGCRNHSRMRSTLAMGCRKLRQSLMLHSAETVGHSIGAATPIWVVGRDWLPNSFHGTVLQPPIGERARLLTTRPGDHHTWAMMTAWSSASISALLPDLSVDIFRISVNYISELLLKYHVQKKPIRIVSNMLVTS
jgi:hypothetical protein